MHSLDHPVKIDEGLEGKAVKTTEVPDSKCVEQLDPQSIPAGLLVTMPSPVPSFRIIRVPSML